MEQYKKKGLKTIGILFVCELADLTNILRGLIIKYYLYKGQTKRTLFDMIDTMHNSNTKSVVDSGLRTM